MADWRNIEMEVVLKTNSSFHPNTESIEHTSKGEFIDELNQMKQSAGLYTFSTIIHDLKGNIIAKGIGHSVKGKINFTLEAKRKEISNG